MFYRRKEKIKFLNQKLLWLPPAAAKICLCGLLLFVASCNGDVNESPYESNHGKSKDKLSYSWSIDKPEDSADVFRSFEKGAEIIPDVEGDYYIKLNISDDESEKEPETITIKVTAKSISGNSSGDKDTFSFDVSNIKKTKYIDRNDPDEEYPFIWAPYPFPFKSDVYSEDLFIRMSFVYESSLNSIDFYIDGAKKGVYECGEQGVSHGETSILFEDPYNEYTSSKAGSCKITLSRFSPTGRVVGKYEAVVVNQELNKSLQISGEFDVRVGSDE